ncbi:NADPH:quinone oxidoreductase family protein [Iamia majanohamensis]|uniref:NADPH:quinone oxidoreductase family protein n=1 Tax=Iamia majanohamensis TaxID=467976 RepID=A0AAE9Y8C9_9ACTN|nr:NADPH:quinone oxidoreductase family protein [Iamia majanohamensis]WCO68457.1 NADPH:quinone oxidoreductase family protein [Iamia majanohamensis]
MQAALVTRLDGPVAVEVADVDAPEAGGRVLIDVAAAGVTYPDVLLTRGEYQMKPTPPFVPGSEVAGTVRSAPEGSGFAAGDRVAALCGIGGFAEVAAAGADSVFPLPDDVSFAEGAALPVNHLTAELALGRRGRVQAGETVLVHGAAGGVGAAAVQVAKVLGARVLAVTSTEEKAALARRLGADETLPVDGFKDAARELTDGRGVDVVVDPVGGDRFTDSLRSLAREGRLLVLGFVGGEIPTVKVNRLLLANTSVVGVAWGELVMATPGLLQEQWARLLPHLEAGALRPAVGATHPLADAGAALARLDERRALGNVVLTVP